MEQINFSTFPKILFEKIASILHLSTTALIRVKVDENNREDALHIGSGTFVRIGNDIHGILTAQHVSQKLEDGDCQLGLDVSTSPHALTIEKKHIRIVEVATPKIEEYGPDLSFIALSSKDVGTIKASKAVFHPLTPDKENLLHKAPHLDEGIWFICGVPAEMTTYESPEASFDTVLVFQHFTASGVIDTEFMRDHYDYAEMIAHHSPSKNLPKSFEGMSGGGLWQVLIEQTPNGEFRALQYFLSGVVFYQSEFKDNSRFIRCHFRQSLYKHLYNMVIAKYT